MKRTSCAKTVITAVASILLWALSAGASVDITGSWLVVIQSLIGPLPAELDFVQSGTDLTLTYSVQGGGSQGPYSGTIDPDAGTFNVPLPDSYGPFPGLECTGNAVIGSATPDGQTIGGTWVAKFFKTTPPVGCFDGGGPFASVATVCGNGAVELGEVCDDGNQENGDCCAADCQSPAADGTPCDDGSTCTSVDECSAGSCSGAGTLTCDPCEICDAGIGCTLPTAPACRPAMPGGKAMITLKKDGPNPAKDRLSWSWRSSGEVNLPGFGQPLTTSDYTLCVIDQLGGAPTLRMSLTAPAGQLCGGAACWTAGTNKFRYKDNNALSDGVTAVILASSAHSGRRRLRVKGKGVLLGVPDLGLVPPVIVRLLRDDAAVCWEASYSTAKINDSSTFKAKSD